MATRKPNAIIDREGFRVEWFSRRSELEANVYIIEPDGTRGRLVEELAYPKLSGVGFNDWMGEVVMIAREGLAKEAK